MLLWHGYCWLLFCLGLFALYACCRELGLSPWAGLLAALFLLLSPRFFAEGHYNNKDVALLSLALCVFWQGLRLMKRPTFPRALCFALAGAFAANARVLGFALWGLCALFVLLHQLGKKSWSGRVAMVGGVTAFAFIGFYWLLTPALWKAPLDFFHYLVKNAMAFSRWENYVRFRGTTFFLKEGPLPWYYLPFMILATTPLWTLLFIALGQGLAIWRLGTNWKAIGGSEKWMGLLLCSLLWMLPLGFALLTRTTVYNGWRHFYFLYGYLLVMAAYGAATIWQWLKTKGKLRAALGVLLTIAMACTGAGIITQHPYQYAYYQPLVGLLAQEDDFELDYWNVSVANVLRAIAVKVPAEDEALTIGYADLWAQAGLLRTLPALEGDLAARFQLAEPEKAAYVLENPTYALFSGYEPDKELHTAMEITAYGRVVMRVYQRSSGKEAAP